MITYMRLHPGSSVPLPIITSPRFTISTFPLSNVRTSSGLLRLFANTFAAVDDHTLVAPGYGHKYDVAVGGKTVPVSYNIIQGSLVGILADPPKHSLDVAVNPGPQGGALEIQVPRYLVDSKTATNTDKSFVVLIDGQRISGEPTGICVGSCPNIFNTFKQTQSSNTDRALTIIFGPE